MPYAFQMKSDDDIVWSEYEDEQIWRTVKQNIGDQEWPAHRALGNPINFDRFGKIRVRITSDHKELESMFPLKMRNAVSESIRNFIEEIEPGVHQFVPVEIVLKSGDRPLSDYYLLNICNRVEAVCRERTIMKKSSYSNTLIASGERDHIVLYSGEIRDMALWTDASISGWEFMSDALHDKLQAAGCTRFTFKKVHLVEGSSS